MSSSTNKDSTWRHVILVTGAAGFIGSHVCDEFVATMPDCLIVGFDMLDYCASLQNLANALQHSNFVFEQGDILDSARLRYVFEKYSVDCVYHLAAQSHVDASFGNSFQFTETNVKGTHVLLEVARAQNAKKPLHRFVHVSTDEVYGTKADESDERALPDPTNPYAASKAAAEMFVRSYYYSYKLPVIITRSNNIYGPRQYPEKVIPRFILRLLGGKRPQVQGDGQQERSFLHATDVARAMRIVLQSGIVGETYNIGVRDYHTIASLARRLTHEIAPSEEISAIEFAANDRPFNDHRYRLNWDKMRALGWQPQVPFEDGLRSTIQWYREQANSEIDKYWMSGTWQAQC